MKKKINNRGFTLAEVLISTIVMSMIMGSVLAFVQYAGDIWHKGNEKISTDNYSRMAFEQIKQDLLETKEILAPSASGKVANAISYKKNDDKEYYIIIDDNSTLIRVCEGKSIYIANNVANFHVNRIATRTLEVSIQIKKEQNEDELEYEDGGKPIYEIVSSDTMVLLAPGVD